MSVQTGILVAMSIGIVGAGLLTAWCVYSRFCEKKDHRE